MKLSILEKVNVSFGIVVLLLVALGWISYWGAAIFVVVALAFLAIDRDWTGRRKTERALKESKEEIHLLLDSTVEAIYGLDLEGKCNFCNPACVRLLGYASEQDILGKDMHGLIHHTRADGSVFPRQECKILVAAREGKSVHVEDEVLWRADRTAFPAEYWAHPVWKGDQMKGAVVTFLDITVRKRNERRVRVQHEATCVLAQASTLTEASSAVLKIVCEYLDWELGLAWIKNPGSDILHCIDIWPNSIYTKEFETRIRGSDLTLNQDFPGRVWVERAPVWIHDVTKEPLSPRAHAMASLGLHGAVAFPIVLGADVLGVMEFYSREGREPEEELTRVFSAVGTQMGQFIERVRAMDDLKQARDTAVDASRAKSEFLATMSHEIRTPMNAIVGMADLLGETSLNPEQKEYVQLLRRGSDTLLKLIDDILDLAKVESGRLELEETEFGLLEFLERTLELLAIRAHQKGLELTCHVASDVPHQFLGDANRLRQILVNLVGNAIKFTQKGEVFVEVKRAEEGPSGGDSACPLVFLVRDTGVGIPEDKWESIFHPFTQVDSSTTRRYGGTGLGLSISKKLVGLMGGRIWIESKILQGTNFYFTLPLKVRPSSEIPCPIPDEVRGSRVLLVDENGSSRFVLKEMLSGWGLVVYEAEGGRQALEEVRRAAQASTPYDLILLDCRMPGMGGFQVAETLNREFRNPPRVVMMLTADARSGDIASARDLGLVGYVIKPVKRFELAELVKQALHQRRSRAETEEPGLKHEASGGRAENPSSLRLLLVEDSEDNRVLIQSYIRKMPYYVDVAENGYMAVQMYTGGGSYDLILMDMHMPLMDGYAATREIRKWEREHENGKSPIPIIALTANALKEDVEKSFEAGCNAHLTKPIKKADLLREISVWSK